MQGHLQIVMISGLVVRAVSFPDERSVRRVGAESEDVNELRVGFEDGLEEDEEEACGAAKEI